MPMTTGAAIAAGISAIGVGAGASASSKDRAQGKKALETQQEFNSGNREFLDKKIELAGRQAEALFGASHKNRLLGSQRGLDILGQTIPQQLSAFQQGNLGAQEQLITGLPQIQNALLGLPTDLSTLQPRQVEVDTSFAQQQLPQFMSPSAALRDFDVSGILRNNQNVVGAGFFDLPPQFQPEGFGNKNTVGHRPVTLPRDSGSVSLGGFGSTFRPFGG